MNAPSGSVPPQISFTALSHGIGLGVLKPAVKKAPQRVSSPVPLATAPISRAPASPASRAAPLPAPFGWPRRLLAWGLDFAFVASMLAVAWTLATLLTAARNGDTANWLSLAPVRWLSGTRPFALVGGVYGIFVAYMLIFKSLAGLTFGESLLKTKAASLQKMGGVLDTGKGR